MDFKTLPIQKVLVGLDLSSLDDKIIAYTAYISQYFPINEVSFMHVTKDLAFPEDMPLEIQQQLATIDDGIRLEMNNKITPHFEKLKNINVIIEVREGNPIDRLYRYSKIKNTDLIILGKKVNDHRYNIVNSSIARKTNCQLLLVPEITSINPIASILVPTDFSDHSKLALEYALQISAKYGSKITCCHAYSLPSGYTRIGKTKEEFSEIMLKNAQKEFLRFTRGYDTAIDCKYILDETDRPVDRIFELSQELKPDLIVIGAKGRTNLAIAFIGSFAEKLSMQDTNIPLLMIKRKGESMGVFAALMQL
jgi:nucleotide-binding universal stress UspA family protein